MLIQNHHLIAVLGSILLTASCQSQSIDTSAKGSKLDPCDSARKTIKVATNVKGRIAVLDVDHPSLWVIVSMQGIIGAKNPVYDGPDIVVPCNLPDSLKQNNLQVIFSGDLKDSQGELPSGISTIYYSQLSDIQSNSKQ